VDAGVCRRHSTTSATANRLGDDRKFRSPNQPISGISHDDAEAYCRFVSKRLPTEAEWERAARGSDARMYPWGDEKPTSDKAVYQAGVTEPVGSRPAGAGPYGHLDLAGNVWEWVADRYDPYAYRRPTAPEGIAGDCEAIEKTLAELRRNKMDGFTGSNPIPEECEFVLRGGAFNYGPWGLRSANRVHHAGRFRLVMSGFRCARDWPDGPVDPPRGAAQPEGG
jgi:formylglycine-generating enzyme required for sulfatase activity